jgi:hypothetical protein
LQGRVAVGLGLLLCDRYRHPSYVILVGLRNVNRGGLWVLATCTVGCWATMCWTGATNSRAANSANRDVSFFAGVPIRGACITRDTIGSQAT